MRPNRSLARGYLATVAFALAAAVACSGRDRSNGTPGDNFKPPVEQTCSPGQTRACGIEIGRTGDVVDCAKGTQTCLDNKAWSVCEATGGNFKAAAPAPKKISGGLGTNAVGGSSTTCVDNPCNPYCQTFNDAPDSGIVSDAVVTTTVSEGVLLSASDVPGGFQNKGTLDSQCTSGSGTLTYMEACQFDMKCGTKSPGVAGCVPFASGEKNACSGIDITAPPVCVSSESLPYRNLTICNRGSVDLTQDIQCMGYPGNSPQYPEAAPGAGQIVLRTGSTVDPATGSANPITAGNPLKAGTCRVYHVPNGNFQSNGTMSIMCNPPSSATPVTTTLLTSPTTVTSTDFTNKDFALSDADSQASASTAFTFAPITPSIYATGVTGNVGFSTTALTQMTGAANSVGTPTALASTTSAYAQPTSATATTWTASTSSTLLADVLTAADGKAASTVINKNDYSWLLTKGYSLTGPTGSLSKLDVAVDATYTAAASAMTGYVYLSKPDGTILGLQDVRTTGVASFALPWGALLASEVPTLEVWVIAHGLGWAGSGTETMRVDRVAVSGTYYDPNYAKANLNGYVWSAPPSGPYTGIEIKPTWKSSSASGAVLYMYVKRVSDNSTVASAFFSPPSGYTVGTWITTQATVAPSTALTTADLTGGLYVYTEAHPVDGGALEIDSVGLSPVYLNGPESRGLRFTGFGISVPAGSTNVKLTAVANYKVDPLATGDFITGRVLSISGSTTTLISQSTASPTNNAFNLYQLGYQAIAAADYTAIEDPKLAVDISVGKGAAAQASLGTSTGLLESLTMRLQYDGIVAGSVGECNPYNNWTVNKANPPTMCAPVTTVVYPPWTVSRVFDASCPDNYRARWRMLGYTSTTPAGTKIDFRVRTYARDSAGACPSLAAATADPPTPVATASLGPPDTQVCSLTATPTTSCPVDLLTKLGNTAASEPCLQMDAYGVPATTPATPASPTLTDWRVTYDCVPME